MYPHIPVDKAARHVASGYPQPSPVSLVQLHQQMLASQRPRHRKRLLRRQTHQANPGTLTCSTIAVQHRSFRCSSELLLLPISYYYFPHICFRNVFCPWQQLGVNACLFVKLLMPMTRGLELRIANRWNFQIGPLKDVLFLLHKCWTTALSKTLQIHRKITVFSIKHRKTSV